MYIAKPKFTTSNHLITKIVVDLYHVNEIFKENKILKKALAGLVVGYEDIQDSDLAIRSASLIFLYDCSDSGLGPKVILGIHDYSLLDDNCLENVFSFEEKNINELSFQDKAFESKVKSVFARFLINPNTIKFPTRELGTKDFPIVMEICTEAKTIWNEFFYKKDEFGNNQKPPKSMTILVDDLDWENYLTELAGYIKSILFLDELNISYGGIEIDSKKFLSKTLLNCQILIPYEKNEGAEILRLNAQLESINKEIAFHEGKLSNQNFILKAKPELVEYARTKLTEYKSQLESINKRLESISFKGAND